MTDNVHSIAGEHMPLPSPPITPPPHPPSLLHKSEEDLYAMAYAEVNSDSRRQGLWAKALSEALGDEHKASAIYIRLRAEQLIAEQHKERRASPVIFECPHCRLKLRLTKGELEDVAASRNPNWNRSCASCKKVFDCRTAILGFDFSLPASNPPSSKAKAGPVTSPQSQDHTAQKIKPAYIISGSTLIIIIIWALMFYFQESNKFKMQKKLGDAYRNNPNQWQR